jgi:hypothetical protein
MNHGVTAKAKESSLCPPLSLLCAFAFCSHLTHRVGMAAFSSGVLSIPR